MSHPLIPLVASASFIFRGIPVRCLSPLAWPRALLQREQASRLEPHFGIWAASWASLWGLPRRGFCLCFLSSSADGGFAGISPLKMNRNGNRKSPAYLYHISVSHDRHFPLNIVRVSKKRKKKIIIPSDQSIHRRNESETEANQSVERERSAT